MTHTAWRVIAVHPTLALHLATEGEANMFDSTDCRWGRLHDALHHK